MIRLATDAGGTFTDLVGFDPENGALIASKCLTTPKRHADGVIEAIRLAAADSGLDPRAVAFFVHGGTTVINAILERKGVKTALVTTRGFRDVLEIGRGNRPDLYNLRARTPPPFVPRSLRFEVSERMLADGQVHAPLAEAELAAIAEACLAQGVEAVAIVFLHAYRNPAHEQRAAEILRRLLPRLTVCASHEISREWREYERSSTAVLNAYVQPVAARYLEDLSQRLGPLGIAKPYFVMQSHGGVTRFEHAALRPLTLVESGPAGGVAGAVRIGAALGLEDVLYLDVGGTTAKCSLIRGGKPEILPLYRLERSRISPGHAVQVPVIDIVEIGAGGGSIIRTDAAGRLRAGPDSAGADPGPVCYGRGGLEPTLTDAAVVLGYLDPGYFAGGRMPLDAAAAEAALAKLGQNIGKSAGEAAASAWQVALANMISALKLVTVERGHDPRRLALIVSGGAGPLFAAELGRILHCRETIIPPFSGNFSAWGMLAAAPLFHLRRSHFAPLSTENLAALETAFAGLEREARQHFGGGAPRLSRALDMRYSGQEHSVAIPVRPGAGTAEIAQAFHAGHRQAYSFSLPEGGIEVTTLAVSAELDVPVAGFTRVAAAAPVNGLRRVTRRTDGEIAWPVFERRHLHAGWSCEGPALIEDAGSTAVIHGGQTAGLTREGILRIAH